MPNYSWMDRMNEAGKKEILNKRMETYFCPSSTTTTTSWFVVLLLACCDSVVVCHNAKTLATGAMNESNAMYRLL